MVEYIVETFYTQYKMAILSRGYRRRTKGYKLADARSSSTSIGDEPYQYYLKYPRVSVAVCEDRVIGVPLLLSDRPETEMIILDDAYQHRSIVPGMSVLLTRYSRPYTRDHVLPMGSLRESRKGVERADVIILTKCPSTLSLSEKQQWTEEIAPQNHQSLYFTTIRYGEAYLLLDPQKTSSISDLHIVAVTGLANDAEMIDYLQKHAASLHTLSYSDHQNYNLQKVEEIKEAYENMPEPKIIITTEKDAVKLLDNRDALQNLPLFVLPIKVEFLFDEGPKFNNHIQKYINENLYDQQEEKYEEQV